MDNFTKSLLNWLSASFSIPMPHSRPEELSDGIALAYTLRQIDGDFFNDQWLNKLKTDCGDNWRLKVSNVKKVIARVLDYYGEVLSISLPLNESQLAGSIGEHSKDVGRLLQLVVGAAVNCPNKEKYIQIIMGLEESVQHVVMKAIQEVMASSHSIPAPPVVAEGSAGLSHAEVVQRLEERLTQEEKLRESLKQKLHDLEGVLQTERQEKALVVEELREMQNQVENQEAPQSIGVKVRQQRDQQSKLESELFKMEMQREDYRTKLEELGAVVRDLTSKNEELMKDRERLNVLKDELDVLKHTKELVGRYEASLDMYRKKMEEMSDLKKQFKILEEKNAEYLQTNVQLEEELSRTSALRAQIEIYKKETQSLHERLTEEIQRADRSEFEVKRSEEKLIALNSEKERLLAERDSLRENVDDLRHTSKQSSPDQAIRGGNEIFEESPAILKEKLYRLQLENETLKKRQTTADQDAYKELNDDMKKLLEETEQKLRASNLKILELESQSADSTLVRELNEKIASLSKELELKKLELRSSEERYDQCIVKAKTVLRNLNDSGNEAALRNELSEKNQMITKLERDVAQIRTQYDEQERLIMTALHNYGAQEQRRAAENRLSGGSFLNKQRQSTSKKFSNPGIQSGDFFD